MQQAANTPSGAAQAAQQPAKQAKASDTSNAAKLRQRREELAAKLAELNKKIRREESKAKGAERKADNRAKLLIGAGLLAAVKGGKLSAQDQQAVTAAVRLAPRFLSEKDGAFLSEWLAAKAKGG